MKPRRSGCHHSRAALVDLTERLRKESRKVTGPRQLILGALRAASQPMTNKEIWAAIGSRECDLATIYRSMHMLVKLGMAQRCDFGDGVARFELAIAAGGLHHHHLICTECSKVVEIEECVALDFESKLAVQNGFKFVTHKLEFFGLCPSCQ